LNAETGGVSYPILSDVDEIVVVRAIKDAHVTIVDLASARRNLSSNDPRRTTAVDATSEGTVITVRRAIESGVSRAIIEAPNSDKTSVRSADRAIAVKARSGKDC